MTNPMHERSSSVVRRKRSESSVLGIDASRALTDTPTGTEYYSLAITRALLEHDGGSHFRLYTRSVPARGLFPLTNNYEIRTIPFPRLWTHLRLAYELLRHPPDALFVPAHVVPPIHPRNSIVTVHDLGYKYFPNAHPWLHRTYLDLSTWWNVKAARVVIADSRTTRDDIMKFYGVPAQKIWVVYPGFNAEVFKPTRDAEEMRRVREKYALSSDYLLAVGTIQPRKNYARLIEAFAAVKTNQLLVIVGKRGWMRDAIFERVRTLGLEGRVRFLDFVPQHELAALYAGAHLAVFPSLYEGFGFPALEAQACETPLLCSNGSSLPEIAGDGALYFDPLDVGEMSNTLQRAIADDDLSAQLVQRGCANLARFSWRQAAREILKIVENFSDL